MVSGQVRLINEHASIEIERRLWPKITRPLNLIRALLAVTDLVLRGVAPSSLAETVHHSIEVVIRQVKEVIDVLKHLDVTI